MKALPTLKILVMMIVMSVVAYVLNYWFSARMNSSYYDFLGWNLFLAWLPFLVSLAAVNLHKNFRYGITFFIILGLLWLLLFPNAPYIITDLIHLTILKQDYVSDGEFTLNYWLDFVIILLFSWIGFVLGFVSAYQFHGLISERFNRAAGWFFILISSLLGGYGILLGRKYTLNSWDIITDLSKLRTIIAESLSFSSLAFSLAFGLLILMIYATLYIFINNQARDDQWR